MDENHGNKKRNKNGHTSKEKNEESSLRKQSKLYFVYKATHLSYKKPFYSKMRVNFVSHQSVSDIERNTFKICNC